jgi:phosphate:Na+ symporter
MNESLYLWKFAAGLGIFLYGMSRMEDTIREMAGKRFKIFLKRATSNRLMAITHGAITTAVLQSSSVVLLLVIAFAGAGIIPLSNSIGIILGANLGTTLTGWLISGLGFKAKIESFVYPVLGIGSLGILFIPRRFYVYNFFSFIMALGLLFLGLDYMKHGMSELADALDLSQLGALGPWGFFLFGLILTAIVQSSSATVAIALGSLHSGLVDIIPAAYIVVGANLGTTITALVASIKGTEIKKRVALAHFLFNVVASTIAIIFWAPIFKLINSSMGINDALYSLSAFQTVFNFAGIILFFPFLNYFEKFLNKLFKNDTSFECQFIHKVSTDVPEAALEMASKELIRFARLVVNFNSSVLGVGMNEKKDETTVFNLFRFLTSETDMAQIYNQLKRIEGEILRYLTTLQQEKLDKEESEKLKGYILALRNGVQSAKSMKDIQHNMKEFNGSVIEMVELFVHQIHHAYLPLQHKLAHYLIAGIDSKLDLQDLEEEAKAAYLKLNDWIYQTTKTNTDLDTQVATFLNVNREIHNADKLLIETMGHIMMKNTTSKSN